MTSGPHPGVLDVRSRRDFSRFDPSPEERPHLSNFGVRARRPRAPAKGHLLQQGLRSQETGLVMPQTPWSLAVLFGHEGRWATLAGVWCPSVPGTRVTSRFDPKVPHFSRKGPRALAQHARGQTSEAQRASETGQALSQTRERRCDHLAVLNTLSVRARSPLSGLLPGGWHRARVKALV